MKAFFYQFAVGFCIGIAFAVPLFLCAVMVFV